MRSVILAAAALALTSPALAADAPLVYPDAPRGNVVDTFFGTQVADPYRWLEDIDSPQTTTFVKAENALTRSYLDAIPARAGIAAAFRKLHNYEREAAPFRAGKQWYYFHNTGLQTQSVMFVRDSETGSAREFFDPNTLSKDGSVQLVSWNFTRDGSLMAYATSEGGADWQTWHVKSVASGRDLPDVLRWSKYSSAAWAGNTGFYYEGYDAPKAGNTTLATVDNHKAWFHRLGTPQSADRLVYTAKSGDNVGLELTQDERYVLLEPANISGSGISWKRRGEPDSAFRVLLPRRTDVQYTLLGNDGSRLYLLTNAGAPRQRIVSIDLSDAAHALRDVVPQNGDRIDNAVLVGKRFYVSQLHDASSRVRMVSTTGSDLGPIGLPGIGTAFFGATLRDDPAVYYTFESMAYPPVIFRFSPVANASTVTFRSPIPFDPAPFVTEQIFTHSKDGTRVPVFVTHRKDMPVDGSTPTILYGYGGFDISQNPFFSRETALWLQLGGAYAIATLRGGAEYGEAWHDAGRLLQKQHVFDDFIAAAQILIDRKITSTPKLAIDGGSNGGLLVAACELERPDLFSAVIAEQGVLDMLRYQKFTVGNVWIPEYGDASASADMFRALYAYSPLHNIKDGVHYPPTLITTADHDDRVFPAHSFKFAAALQHAQGGAAPILLRVQTNEGHFSGLTTDEEIAIAADFYAFLSKNLNFTPDLPGPNL